jgi:hypothetical protein
MYRRNAKHTTIRGVENEVNAPAADGKAVEAAGIAPKLLRRRPPGLLRSSDGRLKEMETAALGSGIKVAAAAAGHRGDKLGKQSMSEERYGNRP